MVSADAVDSGEAERDMEGEEVVVVVSEGGLQVVEVVRVRQCRVMLDGGGVGVRGDARQCYRERGVAAAFARDDEAGETE
jgi:hypothetical protein